MSAGKPDSKAWPYVLAFAERMEKRLEENGHKRSREAWIKDDPWSLFYRMVAETRELNEAMRRGATAEEIADECAEVANFCMMVAEWFVEWGNG